MDLDSYREALARSVIAARQQRDAELNEVWTTRPQSFEDDWHLHMRESAVFRKHERRILDSEQRLLRAMCQFEGTNGKVYEDAPTPAHRRLMEDLIAALIETTTRVVYL